MSLFNAPKFRKPGFKLALVAFVLSVVVILLGTYTRLVDMDFGCSDWPSCHGELSRLSDGTVQAEAFGGYSTGFSLTTGGLWAELAHRYVAGVLGLIIIALAVISWRRRDDEDYPFRLPTFILFLVVWQVLFGMWTVKLSLWPQVVTVHLVMGLISCSLLWLLMLRLDNKRWKVEEDVIKRWCRAKPWIVLAVVLVIVQIMLGGWTSANNAALACPDFPSCQQQWWPEMDIRKGFSVMQGFGPESLSQTTESKARIAIHMVHRVGALVTTLYILGLTLLLITIKHRRTRRMSLIVAVVLGVQLLLIIGGGEVRTSITTVLAHNMGSALLLLTLVTLGTKVWTAKLKYQRPIPEAES